MTACPTPNRGGGLSARTSLLLLAAGSLLPACANRDIQRAHEAVPHRRHDVASPQHQTPPTPPAQPTPPAPPTPPTPPTPPQPPTPPTPPAPTNLAQASPTQQSLREVFPHVRVDASAKVVEFDATVPINAHDPQKPRVYLEVIACPPDTKEHEALLLTSAKPSHVHAALLLIGLEPGAPGRWNWEGEKLETIPPSGPAVKITATYEHNGRRTTVNPAAWVLDVNTQKTLADLEPGAAWLFAGSQMIDRQAQGTYRADADGTLIGLHTFGGETLAWPRMYNPDSGVEEPRLIANASTLPPYNTKVTVRIRPAGNPKPAAATASPPAAQP
ncbi:MAG TPA: YdjY domain-containing protein [Phycisphaerales bacterium]|nr:YdjY domain-containing protein [Phycisphaerales bacterium]